MATARKTCAKARVDRQVQPRQPGIPCAVVYGLLRALLGEPDFVVTVASAMTCIVANLAPATGRQDHTTSPSASASSVFDASASTASRLTFRDVRDTPLFNRGGTARRITDFGKKESELFSPCALEGAQLP